MPGVFLGHGMAGTGTVAGGLHKLGKMLLEILLEQFHGLSKVTNKNLYKCSRTCGVNRLVVRGVFISNLMPGLPPRGGVYNTLKVGFN